MLSKDERDVGSLNRKW